MKSGVPIEYWYKIGKQIVGVLRALTVVLCAVDR